MSLKIELAPTLVPKLTSQAWLQTVVDELESIGPKTDSLVGVDIGHVAQPGLVVSELCAGFVSVDGRIGAACTNFQPRDAEAIARIEREISTSIVPSWMTHSVLCSKRPQINTLVFREFTLTYSFDYQLSAMEQQASFQINLILHETARTTDPNKLVRRIQASVDCFSAVRDGLQDVSLVAPCARQIDEIYQRFISVGIHD